MWATHSHLGWQNGGSGSDWFRSAGWARDHHHRPAQEVSWSWQESNHQVQVWVPSMIHTQAFTNTIRITQKTIDCLLGFFLFLFCLTSRDRSYVPVLFGMKLLGAGKKATTKFRCGYQACSVDNVCRQQILVSKNTPSCFFFCFLEFDFCFSHSFRTAHYHWTERRSRQSYSVICPLFAVGFVLAGP